jgi:hypothetical protein
MRLIRLGLLLPLLAFAGCAVKPFTKEAPAAPPPAETTGTTVDNTGQGPVIAPPPEPTPPPPPPVSQPQVVVPRPPPPPRPRPKVPPAKLSPASQSLVTQAQAQRKKGDLPGASVSLERALKIEPRNPLLWIEMGRLRMDQHNYAQAEALGRKAISMSAGDVRTQSTAWQLVGDSFRARGRNPQAQEAYAKAKEILLPPVEPSTKK